MCAICPHPRQDERRRGYSALTEKTFGPDHPNVHIIRSNLASVLTSMEAG
jgi:hypothetical protein